MNLLKIIRREWFIATQGFYKHVKYTVPTEVKDGVQHYNCTFYTLGPLKRLRLRFLRRVRVGSIMKPGWTGSLPTYAFNCKIHGTVVDRAYGFEDRLECPLCNKEEVLK